MTSPPSRPEACHVTLNATDPFVTSPTGPARETNSSTGAQTFIRDPGGTLIAPRDGTQSHYYLYDGLGSVTGLVNATATKVNSYSYDPYGISRAKTEGVTNPFEYTGGQLDDTTGLYKLGIATTTPPSAASLNLTPPAKTTTTPTPATTQRPTWTPTGTPSSSLCCSSWPAWPAGPRRSWSAAEARLVARWVPTTPPNVPSSPRRRPPRRVVG